jgi:hypothetical protein
MVQPTGSSRANSAMLRIPVAAAACRCVLTGAQLLAEGLSDKGGFAAGFDWAEEQLRQAGLGKIAAEVSS